MQTDKRYVGIDKDINGGMTTTGKIIRDAWIFGILPETETCEGWPLPSKNEPPCRKSLASQMALQAFQNSGVRI